MATVGRENSQLGSATEPTESAQEKAGGLTERAREKAGELKRQAEETAHGMRDRALSAVDEQKHAAVSRVEGVARALRRASDDLREQGQPLVAEYSRYAADGLDSMARSLDRRDFDGIVEGVEDFARHRPVAFLSGAMIVGFALARFMKSSSARRHQRTAYAGDRSTEAATSSPDTPPAGAWSRGTAVPGSGAARTTEAGEYGHGGL
jgi:hypothetical protein